MNDTLSIQEFSKLSGIESSTLRYWDELNIFSPIMRNPDNNYRFYSTSQLPELNFVTTLCDLDIPLKTISKLKESRNPESMLDLFDEIAHKLNFEMERLRVQFSIVHAWRELISHGLRARESDISVVTLSNRAMVLWPKNKYRQGHTYLNALAEHISKMKEHPVIISFPIGGFHADLSSFLDKPCFPDHFISLDPLGAHERTAGEYLVGYTRGDYGKLGDLPYRMVEYAKDNSLVISGPIYTYYLLEGICSLDPSDYLTQCCITISTPETVKTRKPKKR